MSEHVCSVVLLALLLCLWRWMCLCLSSPPFLLCYSPLCAMVPTLLVGSVVVVPLSLSLPAISDCGGVVSPELGLSSPGTESVPVAPVELQDPTPCYCLCRDVGVCGVRSGPVVLAKVLASSLVWCLGYVCFVAFLRCVVLCLAT